VVLHFHHLIGFHGVHMGKYNCTSQQHIPQGFVFLVIKNELKYIKLYRILIPDISFFSLHIFINFSFYL